MHTDFFACTEYVCVCVFVERVSICRCVDVSLSRHVNIWTGLVLSCAHHAWHNVPGADHYGLVHVMAALRPRRRVHGLPLDRMDQAVTFELVGAMLVVVRLHVGLVWIL